MTIILSTREKTLRFTDQFDGMDETKYCDVDITVEHKLYDTGQEFFDIKYKCTYSDTSPACKTLNPFFGGWDGGAEPYDCRNGDIIAANEMSAQMIKYLLMDFEELAQFSGHRTALSYKINLMRAITYLWD